MIPALEQAIAEAAALGAGDLCAAGHQWESEGGRPCPHSDSRERCVSASQPVFRCVVCNRYDYGELGGPGAEACARPCSTRWCDTLAGMEEAWEEEALAAAQQLNGE